MPELSVFWIKLSEDRDAFAAGLRQVRDDQPIAPVILREPGLFHDPNAVMNDVTYLIGEAKDDIMELADRVRRYGGVGLAVLSRRELGLAITSSPLLLPDWFPVAPGREVAARIDDLTWSVHVPLSDGATAMHDLQRILYDIDKALLSRIKETLESDHNRTQALRERILRKGESDMAEVLEGVGLTLNDIKNPGSFRPSTSRKPTIVGRLWFEANRRSPDELPKTAKALASALRAEEFDRRAGAASLMAVLNRSTNPIDNAAVLWAFRMVVTLRSACQLVTAAVHSDDYPMFPDVLLRAVSLDLRRFLDDAILVMKSG